MFDRRDTWRDQVVLAVVCVVGSVVVGAGYTVVAPPLAPYAPVALSGWMFTLIAFGVMTGLAVGIGHRRPRAIMVCAVAVSLLSSGVYAAMLALPAFAPNTPNVVGLVNYALTQATVAFFLVSFVAFPGAIVGLLGSYWWHER